MIFYMIIITTKDEDLNDPHREYPVRPIRATYCRFPMARKPAAVIEMERWPAWVGFQGGLLKRPLLEITA